MPGRQLRLGPIAFWIAVGTLVVMGIWTITTATYFAFRDDVLTTLIARQAELQFAYEDRIAELRAQVDRISSRQLLDQEQYEQKLDQILRRQAALECARKGPQCAARPEHHRLDQVHRARRAARAPARRGRRPSTTTASSRPSSTGPTQRRAGRGIDVEAALSRLHASLDQVERQQRTTLTSMEDSYDAKARRIRGVLNRTRHRRRQSRRPQHRGRRPVCGGALVGGRRLIRLPAAPHHRRPRAGRPPDAHGRTVPLRKPVIGEMDLSSGFGMRIDPFIRAPAMHTGLDFRGDTGDLVRATAEGKVTVAAWNGGYGRMVEIDHGNGLVTRYGHLSAIDVKVGQSCAGGPDHRQDRLDRPFDRSASAL